MINGIPEKEGAKYKSRNVIAKQNYFSLDIAGAYPEVAQVEKWTRSYTLRGEELVLSDEFSLKKAISHNVINFMTWGSVANEQDGLVIITVNGIKALLTYDSRSFKLQVEPIKLSDSRLANIWGEKVYRLSFIAKFLVKKGRYEFKIKKL